MIGRSWIALKNWSTYWLKRKSDCGQSPPRPNESAKSAGILLKIFAHTVKKWNTIFLWCVSPAKTITFQNRQCYFGTGPHLAPASRWPLPRWRNTFLRKAILGSWAIVSAGCFKLAAGLIACRSRILSSCFYGVNNVFGLIIVDFQVEREHTVPLVGIKIAEDHVSFRFRAS